MQTKSNIQIIAETLQAKHKFFNELEHLLEKFTVEDNIFCCGMNGKLEEPETGYFGAVQSYVSLSEAAKEFNIFNQGIRIKGDEVIVGNLYKSLDQVQESTFVDLAKQTVVNS